jgi:diacylglycerol kinase (ATP)
VPSGSGNDFARALGFRGVSDAVASWRRFCDGANNTKKVDLGVIIPAATQDAERGAARYSVLANRYFATVAGVGLDAEVARRANKVPRWLRGSGGYALTLIPTIFRFAPSRMKILTAGNPDSSFLSGRANSAANEPGQDSAWIVRSNQPTLLAAFANAPLYGGGMKIAPRAKMDDGLLDICIVGAVDPLKLFCMFPTVYSGRHLKIREVQYSQAARVRIETEYPLDMYADGEFVCQTPAEIGVQPKALSVLMPWNSWC